MYAAKSNPVRSSDVIARMQSATRRRAITLFEVLITTVVVLVAVAIIIPSLSRKRTQQIMAKNATQMRDIHQAMVTYSQGNKFWFAGATSTGKVDTNGAISNRHGSLMRLQDEEFFEPSYNISPGEIDHSITSDGISATKESQRGSYAVLEYASTPVGTNLTWLGHFEWRDQLNTSAVIMSDRQVGEPGQSRSIWSTRPDQWMGTLCFGDNHVQFELTDGPFLGLYGNSPYCSGTGKIGMLFDRGGRWSGRMVSD